MLHYTENATNIDGFYDFIQQYERVRKQDQDLMLFGLMSLSKETLGYYYKGDFTSRKLEAEETEIFQGEVYGNLTEEICNLLKQWAKISTEKRCKALLKEEIENSRYPRVYAATNFYNLNEERKQHDFLSEDIRFPLDRFHSFHVGTKKEMENYIEATFDPRIMRYSRNYNEYLVLEKEMEEAEKEIVLYGYTTADTPHG